MESTSSEYARFLAYGNQLIEIHIGLRDMLADLREGVVPEAELGTHCLAFCAAVTRHHTGEDTEVFPLLAARHPELRTFLAELERDHQVIAGLLTAVRDVAGRLGATRPDAAGRLGAAGREAAGRLGAEGVREELDGLAAVLETHFIGEEKRLVGVLNAIDPSEGLTGLTA
ncbi:hemerythrin domain-containing protein [Actinoplanes sp. ATCC 53533]|uniref:hemerythrin domain-containing protein n=1 Tax=Actinoplanes sp. ATCC 53533 TaxID=1288362 RepID=UPI001F4135FE|nr:hemerythrin domain-containing protein [Actinoplanes sp. ATCC 53533]